MATTPAAGRLLESASDLFYAHGITAVGVAGIAEAAGVTKKTLYDCFGSKSALVVAYLRHRHDRWWAHLQERLVAAPAPRVLTVFDTYLEHPQLDVARGCAFQHAAAELADDHPGRAVIREHKAAVRDELARLLVDDLPAGADAGEVADLADHLFLLLEGAVARRGVEGDTTGFTGARRAAVALVSGRRGR